MDAISFARGVPAPECIPVTALAECARAAIERDAAALGYGPAAGYPPLRARLAALHGVHPEQVLVTNGSLQGFVFFAQTLARGARVLVEAPTYDRPLKLLAGLGAEVESVPVDAEGLQVDALERMLAAGPPPAFLYTIPTFQNPSGRTMSVERRRRLVEVARAYDLLVLEDDPYGLVRFEGVAAPTLHELEGGEHVVYSSSFSKTIAPGVRVGYLVLPEALAERVTAVATSTYITPGFLAQATVRQFLARGLFEPNVARVCGLLRERRDAMLAALERELAGAASWSVPEGGYFLWLELDGVDASALLERASEAGVTFVPGGDFFADKARGLSAARLAFSFASPDEIDAGVARLARCVAAPRRLAA